MIYEMEQPEKVSVKKACGIDFGTYEIAAAVVSADDPNGVTLVSNYLANETTPGVVKLYNGMRTYAEEALGSATMCPQNVISHIPLVLEYSDCIEKLSEDYPDLCFVVKKADNGEIFFELKDYAVPEVSLTHVMSMLLRYIYGFITKKYPENVKHTVISVPPGVTSSAARQVADAAALAGFEDIKVVTTDLAQAFKYVLF